MTADERKQLAYFIASANSEIKPISVKGKPYSEVHQRIAAFRKIWPDGFILNEIVSNQDGMVIFKTTVGYYDQDGKQVILATGHAYEREGSSQINNTSFLENAETSACGRALGMLGIGIAASVASADEVSNAIHQQAAATNPATEEQLKAIRELKPDPENQKQIAEWFGHTKLEELTQAEANQVLAKRRVKK